VVGVVADGKYVSLTEPQQPFMYLPVAQNFRPRLTLHVRTSGAPAALGESVRAAVHEVDPNLPVFSLQSLEAYVSRSLSRERLLARLLSAMGILALAIAAAGLYGLLAWTVVQRTRELGVRLALGATAGDIARLVLADAVTLLTAGMAAGLAAAAGLSRLVESWLYGVTATDPVTFSAAAGLLGVTALLAASVPLRRALRVDPVAALRAD
jgi:putative ABC transport system permease protein